MYNKKSSKIYAGCALAMALTMAAGPLSVFAAETPADPVTTMDVNTVNPGTDDAGKATKAAELTTRQAIDPSITADDPKTTDKNEAPNTAIDVWGFTENATIYSVDVEWGAMTFEYEKSSWDPVEHKSIAGKGWLVYDNVNEEAIEAEQDAINRVTITNHSNAPVYATLDYAGTKTDDTHDYTAITGEFKAAADTTENVKAAWDDTNACLTLETAATDADNQAIADPTTTAGTPSKANMYFKPTSTVADNVTIDKWTKIGTITVSLLAENPVSP